MSNEYDIEDVIDALHEMNEQPQSENGLVKRFSRKKSNKVERPAAAEVLVDLALDRAMDEEMRDRLASGSVKGFVIDVPDGGWSQPVGDAIAQFLEDVPYVISRSAIPSPRDLNEVNLPRRLREGRLVVGVAPQADRALPPLLLSIADERVTLPPPDAAIITEVIGQCQEGEVPPEAAELRVEILSFDEICSIIVADGKAPETVARLRAAIERKLDVGGRKRKTLPRLEEAIEYGEARKWALGLRDDIADLRAGLIGWDDIDRGCVLHGPPGTGKTLLAQMLGEAVGIPTVVSSIAELFASSSGYLDGVIKALRKTFEEARARAPSILFLDELNALPNVDTVGDRNRDYWLPVITDFYTLLDGAMSGRDGVIVIGATNRIQDIHPALLRPGRLERAIFVGPPDEAGVERIMRHHLAGELADADLGMLAKLDAARKATGAIIEEQIRAARRLARRAKRSLVLADLETQIVGEDHRSPELIRRAAIHEAGHVIAGLAAGGKLEAVSLIRNGDSGGVTTFEHPLDLLLTKPHLEAFIIGMLAGRAAEQVILGDPSQGSGGAEDSDLARATGLVARMHGSLGLGDSIMFRANPDSTSALLVDPEFRRRIDTALHELYQRAIDLVHGRRSALLAVADALIEKRFLTGADVAEIIKSTESILAQSSSKNNTTS